MGGGNSLYELVLVDCDGRMGDYGILRVGSGFGSRLLFPNDYDRVRDGDFSFCNLYLVDVVGAGINFGDYYLNLYGECCFNGGGYYDDIDFEVCRRVIANIGYRFDGVYRIPKDFVRRYMDCYNVGCSINYVSVVKDGDRVYCGGDGNIIILDDCFYNMGLYNKEAIRGLFEKYLNDISRYYPGYVDDIMPFDKWLDNELK